MVPTGKYCHFCGNKLSPADDHDLYSEFDRKAKAAPGSRPVRREGTVRSIITDWPYL